MNTLPLKSNALKKQWMVVYTRSKWEKKSFQLLTEQGINCFCPLVKTKKRWADRNKMVEIPLFASYIFVEVNQYQIAPVQQTPGVVSFIHYCGKPATISETEINRIKQIVDTYTDVETVSMQTLQIGDKVMINNGPLVDCDGEVIQIRGKSVVMLIKNLDCALIVEVKESQLLLQPLVAC